MPLSPFRIVMACGRAVDAEQARQRLSDTPAASFAIRLARTLAQALAQLAAIAADAIILDLDLPDSQGLDTLAAVRLVSGEAPVIVVCERADEALRCQALAAGAHDVLDRAEVDSRLFSRSVLYAIERHRASLQQRRLEALLDATPDAILVAHSSGALRYVNQAAAALFGKRRDVLLAERLSFPVVGGDATEVDMAVGASGERRACELRVAPLEWDGEPTQLLTLRDITLRKNADALRARGAELELQHFKMEQAGRLKDEFLANMSHEIRTPMNAIIGLSHLLGQTRLSEHQRGLLTQAQIASRSLLGVINDVLDISKIEAGELSTEQAPFDLRRLLRELSQMLQAQAEARHIELQVHHPDSVPGWVVGDATRLRQILTNLLGNALKFTEQGRVDLSVQCMPGAGDGLVLQFSVRDTGIGIAAQDLQRLFTPFTQADASITRRFGGTGLGLSIVRQLARLMGGEVQVHSTPGAGSEFRVTLPMGRASEAAAGPAPAAHTLDVLVSEPSAGQRRALRSMARSLGWRVECVEFAEPALERWGRRLRQGPTPDVWIIGPQPDEARALRLLARLREDVGPARWPACVSLRAGHASHSACAPVPGLVDVHMNLRGPLTPLALFEAVQAALAASQRDPARLMQVTHLDAVGAQWLVGASLLVVDDSEVNLEVSRRLLEREGARVRTCGNGREALQLLRARTPEIDAVLMDVQMPEIDGLSATRAIRADPALRHLPVIALSAGAFVSERQRALDAGMDDFIGKPFDPDAFIQAVRGHVQRARGAPLPLVSRADAARPPAPAWPHVEGVDGRDVAARLGHDVRLFASMLGRMLREFGALGASAAPRAGDEAGRRRLAARLHKLHGSAGMLGAKDIQRRARELETALASAAPGTTAATLLAELGVALAALAAQARPLLDAHAANAALAADRSAPPLEPNSIGQLVELLVAQDISAQKRFQSLSRSLRAELGQTEFGRLSEAMENLEFRQVASVLKERGRGG